MLAAVVLAVTMSAQAPAAELDRDQVAMTMKAAWKDRIPCHPVSLCSSYFDTFGVALLFADGSAKPFEHVQRQSASGYDCLRKARRYADEGDRVRAVEWAMASQTSEVVRDWMRDHPDVVLELLTSCCKA